MKYLHEEEGFKLTDTTPIGLTALHIAVERSNMEIAHYLIDEGIDINATTKNGWNILHYAAKDGNLEMTIWLLSLGVNSKVRNSDGNTPNMLADLKGHSEVGEYLKLSMCIIIYNNHLYSFYFFPFIFHFSPFYYISYFMIYYSSTNSTKSSLFDW